MTLAACPGNGTSGRLSRSRDSSSPLILRFTSPVSTRQAAALLDVLHVAVHQARTVSKLRKWGPQSRPKTGAVLGPFRCHARNCERYRNRPRRWRGSRREAIRQRGCARTAQEPSQTPVTPRSRSAVIEVPCGFVGNGGSGVGCPKAQHRCGSGAGVSQAATDQELSALAAIYSFERGAMQVGLCGLPRLTVSYKPL